MSETTKNLARRISLRPVDLAEDEDFLVKLYRSTRDDLEMIPLDDATKNLLIQTQYSAQKQHYAAQYPNTAHDIILLDSEKAGRLMIERDDKKILGVDLAILPEYRSLGIGTVIIEDLLKEATQTNRIFVLHVVKTNVAVRLYRRLGIEVTKDTGTHFRMEFHPQIIK